MPAAGGVTPLPDPDPEPDPSVTMRHEVCHDESVDPLPTARPKALYNVRLLSPPEGERGDAAAEIVAGNLTLWSDLPSDGTGGVYIAATSQADAIFKAVIGAVTVNLSTVYEGVADPTYQFLWSQTAEGAGGQGPFRITSDRIELEDSAAVPDRCDWDFNDDLWRVSCVPVSLTLDAPWQGQTKEQWTTILEKNKIVGADMPNGDAARGKVFEKQVELSLGTPRRNAQPFETGVPDPQTTTPDFLGHVRSVPQKLDGTAGPPYELRKGPWMDAKMTDRNVPLNNDSRGLVRGPSRHRASTAQQPRYVMPHLVYITNDGISVASGIVDEANAHQVLVEHATTQWRPTEKGYGFRVAKGSHLNTGTVLGQMPPALPDGTPVRWLQPGLRFPEASLASIVESDA